MGELILTLAVGGGVALFGLALLAMHVVTWRRQQRNGALADRERQHLRKQYRRRVQTSVLIVLLGLLLCLSTKQVPWQQSPALFALYILVLLGLVLWIVLLALGDFFANRLHNAVAVSEVRRKQQELQAELTRLRRRSSDGNGSPAE